MSFETLQEARMVVGETEMYVFDFGGTIGREYYTTNRKRVSWTPQTTPVWPDANVLWTPLPIARSSQKTQNKISAAKPKITMPCRPNFVNLLKDGGLDSLFVTIIRGFGTDYDNDFRNPWFRGWLTDLNVTTKLVTGSLQSIEEVFSTRLPRVVYQSLCNNALHDNTCAEPFVFQYGTVVSITEGGRKLVLDISSNNSDISLSVDIHHYTLGRAWRRVESPPGTPDPDDPRSFRECLYSSNNLGDDTIEVQTHAPILGLSIGDKVNLSPGCDHSIDTCILKFNNRPKFVGMPIVPGVAPVTEGF